MSRPITIVGGGLAGLTLGIALRREKIPVQVIEAGQYPRQRVCGEFISGRGIESLERLGILDSLKGDCLSVAQSSFHFRHGRIGPLKLPRPGLSISRRVLDERLAILFQSLGGNLVVGKRWSEGFEKAGVVRATGRRIDTDGESNVLGLKVHAAEPDLASSLEMHFGVNSRLIRFLAFPFPASRLFAFIRGCPAQRVRANSIDTICGAPLPQQNSRRCPRRKKRS